MPGKLRELRAAIEAISTPLKGWRKALVEGNAGERVFSRDSMS
jgi:hypothetical protein